MDLPDSLTVGDSGTATLNIGVGGTPGVVTSTFGVVGNGAAANGAVVITGAGSSWSTGGSSISIGIAGTGSVSVAGGGLLDTGISVVGNNAVGTGTATVTGAGSTWNATQMYVGYHGTGGVTVSAGGTVAAASFVVLGEFTDGRGTLTVTGAGSALQTNGLAIGSIGRGTASILAGGSLVSNGANIGGAATAVGQLTVDGAGSTWTSSNVLLLGNSGNGTMSITGGGFVTNTDARVGVNLGGVGTVTVTGLNSGWVSTGGLTVGEGGTGSLTIADQAGVLADAASIASQNGGVGTVLVTGAGSTLRVTNALTVANFGQGTLTIADGAQVTSGDAFVANQTNSTGSVDVTGPGSLFVNQGNLGVGVAGTGSLRVSGGGSVETHGAGFVGYMPGSWGYAQVVGAGSVWTTAGDIYVGGDSGNSGIGLLTIADGGQVAVNSGNGTIYLGVAPGSSGTLTIGGEMPLPGYNPPAAPGTLNAAGVYLGYTTGVLQFNHTGDNYVFAPVISGAGGIVHVAGTTHLTADSSGFTGVTALVGGRLVIDGKLGGTTYVEQQAVLSGTGTVFNLTAYNGGTVAPGNSIGTLNVAGSVIFEPTSVYQVEVNAAGQSDKIAAVGLATITGGTVQVLAGTGNYAPTTTYTILSAAGGRTGTFDTVTSNFAFLAPTLTYDANNVYLTLTRNLTDFAAIGATPNQKAAGAGAATLASGNPVYDALLLLSPQQARDAFDRLSGEIHASTKSVLVEDSHQTRDAAINRLRAAFADVGAASSQVMAYDATAGGFAAATPTVERLALLGRGLRRLGQQQRRRQRRARRPLQRRLRDRRRRAGSRPGTARRVRRLQPDQFSADARASSGTSDNYHVGLYGGGQWNAVSLRGGVAYTWHDISSHRTVNFPGFSNSLGGSSRAGTAQVFGELGYGLRAGRFSVEPFANLAHVSLRSDGATESGGTAALTAQSGRTDTTFTTLGLRGAHDVWVGGVAGTIRATLGWRHAFGDTTPTSTLAFAGGGPFTIAGVPISKDAALVEGGLDLTLTPTAVLGLTYGGQFASGAVDQTLRAEFNMKF